VVPDGVNGSTAGSGPVGRGSSPCRGAVGVAQLVEQRFVEPPVAGSRPAVHPTCPLRRDSRTAHVADRDGAGSIPAPATTRVLADHLLGVEEEAARLTRKSSRDRHHDDERAAFVSFASLAQWIEHRTTDAGVGGSNPSRGTSRTDGRRTPPSDPRWSAGRPAGFWCQPPLVRFQLGERNNTRTRQRLIPVGVTAARRPLVPVGRGSNPRRGAHTRALPPEAP
jgi:hypothetical protein